MLNVSTHVARKLAICTLVFFAFSSGAVAQVPGLTEPEFREVLKWNRNELESLGTLLNSPVGRHSPEVREANELLKNIVERLAGPQLRQHGIKVSLSIYSGSEINAFARQWSPDDWPSPEHEWRRTHPTETWPLRRLYGVGPTEVFYEIGISTALLGACSNVDEIAFVMAHELTHILEGHTNRVEYKMNKLAERWWSAQQFEVVADLGALDLMKSKFNLRSALTVLNLLARNSA
ncbi:MAG: M48 family metalloprotease, partial [Bdellovibrionia bacterium]